MKKMKLEKCGPGCDCGKPSGHKKLKSIICLIVLLAISGIFVYKAQSGNQTPSDNAETAYTMPALTNVNGLEPAVKSLDGKKIVGESLSSLSSLNTVALNTDAVLIFIPAKGNETVDKKTIDAIASAEKTIKAAGKNLGLFTLQYGTPEYADIAKQLPVLPGMLVMSKGLGAVGVAGEITETKILQAYVSSSSAGGCCPPGSSTVCK
jgi:hypothetical protein